MYINKKAIPLLIIVCLLLAGAYLYTAPLEILSLPIQQDNHSTQIKYGWVETPETYHNLILQDLEMEESYDLSNHHGSVGILVNMCDFADTDTWQINKIQELQTIQNTSYEIFVDTYCGTTETKEFHNRFTNILNSLNLTDTVLYINSYHNYDFPNISYLKTSKWGGK